MKSPKLALALFAVLICGCAATGSSVSTSGGDTPASPLGSPFADHRSGFASIAFPLLLDRGDYRLGTTVQYNRIPTLAELDDLSREPSLQHVVITLPGWPAEYAPLEALNRLPTETDVVVVLPGYPPTRGAANAWNLVEARLRLVVVVTGPPPSAAVVGDLNALRALERVIAQLDDPDRAGFERLQRPLSYRVLKE